jgi:hypothetical protein
MDNIIMDVRSNVNVIPRQTWEIMSELKLIWSLVQLRLANQLKIVPIGRMTRVSVSIDGVRSMANSEVIEIVDGSTPYPTLLGPDWAFENYTIIDLKKRHMIFEVENLKVISSLDPTEGRRYVEPGKGKELDNLHNMTTRMNNYVNPTVDGVLSWRSISSCASNSEEALEN